MRAARRPWLRRALLAAAVACLGMALWTAAAGSQGSAPQPPAGTRADPALLARGKALFADACAECHGDDLRGRSGQGPSLIGAGAGAVDFYVSTGRMPLASPTDEPVRARPAYGRRDIAALVAYVGAFGATTLPDANPKDGSVASGKESFTEHCAGCHQIMGRGGIVTGAFVPSLQDASPRQLAEAVRVGPYLMPRFSENEIDQAELDDLAAYVQFSKHPDNRGGWGIGNIGPIPEGLVAWLLAGVVLLGVLRWLGERAPS
jgi:ubiquinol-cytochrome c reductase cytochrome c subunit